MKLPLDLREKTVGNTVMLPLLRAHLTYSHVKAYEDNQIEDLVRSEPTAVPTDLSQLQR